MRLFGLVDGYVDRFDRAALLTPPFDLDWQVTRRHVPGTLRLFLLSPRVVFAARVNQPDAASYPVDSIAYDGVTVGSYGDIGAHMTITVGTGTGLSDLGRQRVRKVATSDTIYVGRSSEGIHDGELTLADNAYITVYDDYRVWPRPPYIVVKDDDPDHAVTFKDGDIAYGDQNSESIPVCNMGPPAAGTINPESGLLAVSFDASGSYATADGASIASYNWQLTDGTVVAGAQDQPTLTATFPAGFRWVHCTVTDSNGKTMTGYRFVYARDPDDDDTIGAIEITSHRITPQGQQLSVRILQDIPASTYPDGTLVVLMDGEPTSPADRANLVFWGWHEQDPAQIAAGKYATLADTTLTCVDVAGRLDNLPGWPQIIQTDSSPAKWEEMASANLDKYLHYLLLWHSTALVVTDFYWSGAGSDYPFYSLESDAQSLWAQLAQRAQAFVPDRLMACNRRGQLAVPVDPLLQDEEDRTDTVQAALTAADWSGLRFAHKRSPTVHWLHGDAILAGSGANPKARFSLAPGNAPGWGEQDVTHSYQLTPSQDTLNAVTGMRYARLNAPDGPYEVTLVGSDDLGIDPAALQWVTLAIPADIAAQRGLSLSSVRCLPKEANIRYQHSKTGTVRTVELSLERETSGPPAQTYTPPAPSSITTTPPTVWGPGLHDTPPPVGTGSGLGTVYAMTQSRLGRTRDFSAESPTWAFIEPAGESETLSSRHFKDFILDPWSPATTGYLATLLGIYKSSDLDNETPTWTLVCPAETLESAVEGTVHQTHLYAAKLLGSSHIQDYVAYWYELDNGLHVCRAVTTDGGTSWAVDDVGPEIGDGFSAAFHDTTPGAVDIVPYLVGGQPVFYLADGRSDALFRYSPLTGWTGGPYPYGTSGWGINYDRARCVHCPVDGNEDGKSVWIGILNNTIGANAGLLHATDGVDMGAAEVSSTLHPGPKRGGIESYVGDRNQLYLWHYDTDGVTSVFYVSQDGGASWTTPAMTGFHGRAAAASGFPYNGGQYYVLTSPVAGQGGIYLSQDGGETWQDKTGNWTEEMDWDFLTDVANGVIVPLWTE